MKVSILAAVTLDGFIAHSSQDTVIDWTSSADKAWVKEITTRSGFVIMGRNTFKTFKQPLSERRNIVLTRRPDQEVPQSGVEFTDLSPKQLLDKIEQEGCLEAIVFGGGQIFELFLSQGLVDTLYLTLAGRIFGRGISFPYAAISTAATIAATSSRPLGQGEMLYEIALKS